MSTQDQPDSNFSGAEENSESRIPAEDAGHAQGSIRFPLESGGWDGEPVRPLNRKRFMLGFLLAGCGIAIMLSVAVGALQTAGFNGGLSLPSVALCMVSGLMLLGGGFGIMATSSAQFDDGGLRGGVSESEESPSPAPLNAAVSCSQKGDPAAEQPTSSAAGPIGKKDPAARQKMIRSVDQSA